MKDRKAHKNLLIIKLGEFERIASKNFVGTSLAITTKLIRETRPVINWFSV